MPTTETTLSGVLVKVKSIALNNYNDRIYDNILPIFSTLHTTEKKIFLKGLLNICYIMNDGEQVSVKKVKEMVDTSKTATDLEIANLDQANKLELIKLKSWMIKLFAITVTFLIIAIVVGFLSILSPEDLTKLGSIVMTIITTK